MNETEVVKTTAIAGKNTDSSHSDTSTDEFADLYDTNTNTPIDNIDTQAGDPSTSVSENGEQLPDLENMQYPDFIQYLEKLGIDLEAQKDGIEAFAHACGMIGIPEILADENLTNVEKDEKIKDALVEADTDPAEGLKKFAAVFGFIVEQFQLDGSSIQDFLSGGGFSRFISAIMDGAGHNSSSAIRNHEAENPNEVVTSKKFFELMNQNSTAVIDNLLENRRAYEEAGWKFDDKGWELLNKGKSNPKLAKEALLAVFVGKEQEGITSLAEHLRDRVDNVDLWKKISPTLAKMFDDGKTMVSLDVKDQFLKFLAGDDPTKSDYFGKAD